MDRAGYPGVVQSGAKCQHIVAAAKLAVHDRLEHRPAGGRASPLAVADAHASKPALARAVDKVEQRSFGFGREEPVQIEPSRSPMDIAGGIAAHFETIGPPAPMLEACARRAGSAEGLIAWSGASRLSCLNASFGFRSPGFAALGVRQLHAGFELLWIESLASAIDSFLTRLPIMQSIY